MTDEEIRSTVLAVLRRIAPEADPTTLAPDVEWQEQLDLDSMNLLAFMVGLEEATGVSVPERDYAKVATLDRCVAYLSSKLASRSAITAPN